MVEERHRNGIAFCRIRTQKLCFGCGWVGGRNAASGNLILSTLEGIIIESIRNHHTAAWCAVGPLSVGRECCWGLLVGAWWMASIFCQCRSRMLAFEVFVIWFLGDLKSVLKVSFPYYYVSKA